MGDSPEPSIRVSDAERDLARTALWEHLETDRLRPGDHEERCALAAAATTRADLEALFADLPAPHPDLSTAVAPTAVTGEPEKPPASDVPDTLAGVGLLVFVFTVPVAIMLTVIYGMWWTFFPVVGLTTLFFVLAGVVEHRLAGRADGQVSRTGL